jgi:NitT/TauT family transport system substrate-binding protein
MHRHQNQSFNRRRFLAGSAALSGAAWLGRSQPARAEPPPEITTIRLEDFPAICMAPQYLAEELLYAEGFAKVEYPENLANVAMPPDSNDFGMMSAAILVNELDAGSQWVALAGTHAGCQELFGNDRVRSLRDIHGKIVAISGKGSGEHLFISSAAAYVGIDPKKEINWLISNSSAGALQMFMEGRADVYYGFAPQPQLLRAKKIGHVILNTTEDKPWSQYFCCLVAARREFVQRYPVATKRALRALLKATDLCANDPERAARLMADKGHKPGYELSLEILKNLPFARWREDSAEDTLRFHALRLHEVGMIKTDPNTLIARSTDWRFLNELKRELKA